MKKHLTKYIVNTDSYLARQMSRPVMRFGAAIFMGGIMAIVTLLIMKSLINDYDEATENAVFRIFNLNTVTLTDKGYTAVPYSEYSDEGLKNINTEEQVNIPETETKSKELQEILRKKNEIITILEKDS